MKKHEAGYSVKPLSSEAEFRRRPHRRGAADEFQRFHSYIAMRDYPEADIFKMMDRVREGFNAWENEGRPTFATI